MHVCVHVCGMWLAAVGVWDVPLCSFLTAVLQLLLKVTCFACVFILRFLCEFQLHLLFWSAAKILKGILTTLQ